jgi:hypothetical protein
LKARTTTKVSSKKPAAEKSPITLSPPPIEDFIAEIQQIARTLPDGEEVTRGYYRPRTKFKEKDREFHFPKFGHLLTAAGLKGAKNQKEEDNPSQHITDEEQDLIYDKSYVYNKEQDVYITPLPRGLGGKSIILRGELHRAMLQSYSNWDGNSETINEICRKFRIRRDWFMEYKSLHGWTHDKEPFTNEELVTRDVEDMAEDALQRRRLQLFNSFQKKEWRTTISDARNWNHFEQSVFIPLSEQIKQALPEYKPPMVAIPKSDPYALVVAPFDLHYGKYGWMDETGQGYSRNEARELLMDKTNELASYVAKLGRPEVIIVASGSDWFHIDNQFNSTTRGTPQDVDGTASQILMEGCHLAYDHIEMLRQIAPIKYVNVPGNHDYNNAVSMMMFLLAKYTDAKDVEIIQSSRKRQYVGYGNSILGFGHGDCITPKDMMSAMVKEAKDLFTASEFQYFFSGHLHHEIAREIGGLTHYQLKSLSGIDRYHSKHGYITSGRALQSFVVSRNSGVTVQINCNVRGDTLFGVKERNVNAKKKGRK